MDGTTLLNGIVARMDGEREARISTLQRDIEQHEHMLFKLWGRDDQYFNDHELQARYEALREALEARIAEDKRELASLEALDTAGAKFLISREEAAERYGMSLRTFDGLYKRNKDFPVVRVGARVMIPVRAADTWFTANIGCTLEA